MPQPKSAHSRIATVLLLAVAASVVAQQPPDSQPQTSGTTLKTISRLTLVDVTVTDSKGNPVHGLTQSDFNVKEDGKPEPIQSFQERGTGIAPAQTASPRLPSNVYTNIPPPASSTGALSVLLFDDVTTGLADKLQAPRSGVMYEQQQAAHYLETLPAGTQVAVLQMTEGVRVVQGFTSDRDLLLAAIHSLLYKSVDGTFLHPDDQTPPCQVANRQSEAVLNGLDRAAAFLTGVQGRKNLIWFTPGIPWLTNYQRFSGVRCLVNFTQELQRIYGLLAAAQVSLYPVDPRGVKGCERSISETTNLHDSPDTMANTSCFNALPDDHSSLDDMANATGGKAYYNRNDVDREVREAIADGSDYYALSYIPPASKFDGQYHSIKVSVDRPGIHLQYRDGYVSLDLAKPPKIASKSRDKNAPRPMSEFQAAMSHGVAPSTGLLFDVRVLPSAKPGGPSAIGSLNPSLKGKPLVRYNFSFILPSNQITLEDGPDQTHIATVELALAAYDGDGKILNSLEQAGEVAVKPEMLASFLARPFQVPLELDLPTGSIFVRVGVRDRSSGKIGTLEVPLTVTK